MFRSIHLTNQFESADSQLTSLVVEQPEHGLPIITYWGPALPYERKEVELLDSQVGQTMGAGVDAPEMPSLLPTQAEGWTGTPLISVRRGANTQFLQLQTADVHHDASGAQIIARDASAGVQVEFSLQVTPSGIIELQTTLTNLGSEELHVERLWQTIPLPADHLELLSFSGHHNRERTPQRARFSEGLFAKESCVGRPDFNSAFLMCAGTPGFDSERGNVRTAHVAWSGNVTHFAVRTPYSHGLLGGGELLYSGEVSLREGEQYQTPPLLVAWGHGLNGTSQKYHAYIRAKHERIVPPITLNTWEAVYFDHNETSMMELAHTAADLGVERFVIDDGWFKGRRNDTKALGDWQVDLDVWPNGLEPIARTVHELGMEFGLWFEPEMVSLDSDLAREHPDWILRPNTERLPLPGRSQYVLDFTNPDVVEHLFTQIGAHIRELGIDYIKWDHNRFVTEAVSAYSGKPVGHAQTANLYALIDRLRAAHPGLDIEACSSGGGRVDLGMLSRCPRVWVSDCTDPVERVNIQKYTSLLVPPEMMGAHIAESPSHVTGRTTPLTTRAAVACMGSLGLEWNILALEAPARARIKQWFSLYKQIRERLYEGEAACATAHTATSDPAVSMTGLRLGDWSLWCFSMLQTSEHYPLSAVRMPGLDPQAKYRVRPFADPALYAKQVLPSAHSNLAWWNEDGVVVSGRVLTDWGIRPLQIMPGTAVLIEVERVR